MAKKLQYLLIIISTFSFGYVQANEELKLYSSAGYPYENLIRKAKAINVLFIEKSDGISCRVQATWSAKQKITNRVFVSKEEFTQTPLKSCLPRKEAKKLLSAVAFDYL